MKKTCIRFIELLFNIKLIEIKQVGNAERQKTIVDLKEGETKYITPWSYNPDTGLIDLSATIYDKAEGTASLAITMKDDCIEVDVNSSYFDRKYKWV